MSGYTRVNIRIEERLDVKSEGKVITTSKGDLITDNGTQSIRQPIGSDGQFLHSNSAESNGLDWKSLVSTDINDFDTAVSNNSNVSSNTVHQSDTNNPHNITKSQIGLGNVYNLKANLTATSAPNTNNDTTSGYAVGSIWVDTNNQKVYMALDTTTNNAVWTEITVTSSGEINTASNIGTSGVGLFKQKTNNDLEFKKIDTDSNKITVTSNNDTISLDIDESVIDITNLLNAPSGISVGTTDQQTLSQKSFIDNSTYFIDDSDNTKKFQFQAGDITTSTTRTYTMPDTNTTLVGDNTTQTLINKTMTNPIISSISNSGTLTLPTSTDTLVGTNTTDTLTNKTLTNPTISTINNSGTLTLPTSTDVLVARATTDILSNKTLVSPTISTIINTGTLTLPTSTDTIVGRNTTDTFTNKTFADMIDMNSNRIINVGTPTSDSDAVNKSYADGLITGIDNKASVKIATTDDLDNNTSISGSITYNATGGTSSRGQITATLNVSDLFTVDSVNFSSSDDGTRIMLKDQTNGDQNGIWTMTISGTSLTLDRASDFDSDSEVTSGAYTYVEQGIQHSSSGWRLLTADPITIGGGSGTSLEFTQHSGAGQIIAGFGIVKNGNTLSVIGSSTIIANADDLQVNSSNTTNQVLLSSGTTQTAPSYGSLPLDDSNAVTGTLPINNGGTNTTSFSAGSRIIATNSGNTALESTSINPSSIATLDDTQTFTNKTFTDNTNIFQNNTNNTKKFKFDSSIITAGQTRTVLIPDADITMVGIDTTQTITNKTLSNPIISTITNTGTLTLPTSTDTLVARNTTDTFTNKTLSSPIISTIVNTGTLTLPTSTDTLMGRDTTDTLNNKTLVDLTTFFVDDNDQTKKLQLQLSAVSTGNTRVLTIPDQNTTIAGTDATQTFTNKTINADNNTITNITNSQIKSGAGIDVLKIADGSVSNTSFEYLSGLSSGAIGTSDSQTLTNKTLTDTSTYLQNNSDNTKKAQFNLSSITSGTTRTFTLPDKTTELSGTDTTQTFTNKTFDATTNTITNISNTSIDSSAAIDVTKIADGSINNTEFQYLNGLSSTVVGINDTQSLTNKTLTIPKVQTSINDINNNELIGVTATANAVNEIHVTNTTAGNGPIISASGNDTNIDMNINAKGSGNVTMSGLKYPSNDGSVDQVIGTDGSGNLSFIDVPGLQINTVTTTNNIETTITTIATESDTAYIIETSIIGLRTDSGSEASGFNIKAVFKNISGTLTKVGQDLLHSKDSASWNVTIEPNTTNIIISVQGESSKTIKWKASTKTTVV